MLFSSVSSVFWGCGWRAVGLVQSLLSPNVGALPEGLECRYLSLLILVHLKINDILNELKIFATVSFVRTCLHQSSV